MYSLRGTASKTRSTIQETFYRLIDVPILSEELMRTIICACMCFTHMHMIYARMFFLRGTASNRCSIACPYSTSRVDAYYDTRSHVLCTYAYHMRLHVLCAYATRLVWPCGTQGQPRQLVTVDAFASIRLIAMNSDFNRPCSHAMRQLAPAGTQPPCMGLARSTPFSKGFTHAGVWLTGV